jgi:hypothetical protein
MLELASGVMLSLLKKDPAYAAVRQRALHQPPRVLKPGHRP